MRKSNFIKTLNKKMQLEKEINNKLKELLNLDIKIREKNINLFKDILKFKKIYNMTYKLNDLMTLKYAVDDAYNQLILNKKTFILLNKMRKEIKNLNNEWLKLMKEGEIKEAEEVAKKIKKLKYDLSQDKNKYKIVIKKTSIFGSVFYYEYILIPSNYGFLFKINKYDKDFNLIKKGRMYKNKRLLYSSIEEAKKELLTGEYCLNSELIKFEIIKNV